MITLKTEDEIAKMREAGRIAAMTLDMIKGHIKPGVTTAYLDELCHNFISANNCIPAPLNYNGFPKSVCTSVNEVVCHGVPNNKKLKNGDLVSIDVTVILDGWHGDTCRTFKVGAADYHETDLIQKTYDAMMAGIAAIRVGGNIRDIGEAIERFITQNTSYGIVREFVGHGIGKGFHEEPYVPHYAMSGADTLIVPGMVFTVEPMINEGLPYVVMDQTPWVTATTVDGKPSAQFEHTVAVHQDGRIEILTLP